MIVFDTNVVAEAMKPQPDAAVRTWLNEQAGTSRQQKPFHLSSVTIAELLFGIRVLPAGRRKNILDRAVSELLDLFKDRVLPFDTDAARRYAELAAKARAGGHGFPTPDGYIAAIAASRGFAVASRDTAPYEAAGVPVIDPWRAAD